MKTKIKIVLLCILGIHLSGGISDIHAHFYGTHPQVLTGISNCLPDAQPDVMGPPMADSCILPGSVGCGYVVQARVVGANSCQYWDSTAPTVSSLNYANAATAGWQNSTTINLSWSANDTGGSGLMNYDVRVYSSNQVQSMSPAWGAPTTILAASTATSYSYVGVNGYAYKFEVIPHDVAGNVGSSWLTSSDIARIDTVAPVVASVVTTTNSQLLANTVQAFSFTYPNDGGSPVRIASRFEDFANSTLYILVSNSPLFNWAFTSNQNISLVDGLDRIADGNSARQYTYQFTQICDQAGNCWNGTRDFNYNVYANPNSLPAPVSTQDSSALIGAIADGIGHNFIHTISDGYGNDIIPAAGINRIITMTLSGITNTMYLNQYTRSGPTSVYVTAPNNTLDNPLNFSSTQTFASPMISSNGSYPLTLKAYTPTATGYLITDPVSDSIAAFGLTTNLVINDTLIGPSRTFSQSLSNPSFIPLYTTSIMGDLRDGGFIEGTEQISSINVIDNNVALVSPSSIELQLEFSGSDAGKFNMYGGSMSGSTSLITSKNIMINNPGFTSTGLYTKLLQKPGLVATGSNLQLSTHFSYALDSKSIVYNSDIVGKDGGYWSGSGVTVGNQVGIKVIGPIASNAILAIINDQFATETSIFNGLSRVIVRDKIRQSITTATRNINSVSVSPIVDNVSTLNLGGPAFGSKIENGNSSLVRIEKAGGYVTLSLPGGISGKRTLVIKGADLYITNNMYYSASSPNSILGVVVQKNEAGQGGNLYINPSVTNVVGTYVIDGSIMSSSDGVSPIGTSNISLLKNQLYIYGSIVSENTIGGSRMSPLKCPSLINTTCATVDEAQKYDLNYLRRYYLYGDEPFGGATTSVTGSGTCSSGTCGGFNSNLIQKFSSPNEDLAKYPVIVEYNPVIRINPPIGFE